MQTWRAPLFNGMRENGKSSNSIKAAQYFGFVITKRYKYRWHNAFRNGFGLKPFI